MDEQSNESQDTLIPDEETIQDIEIGSTDSEVDIEDLRNKAAKSEEYKRYADRVAAENKELKKRTTENLKTNESSSITREDFERLELKTEGYKVAEIDFLMRNGGKSALQDKLVLSAIESQRKSEKSQDATPSGTGKSAVYQKYTEDDLKTMSAEEMLKIIPK